MRVSQPEGTRGSLKWIQRAVSEGWPDLIRPIIQSCQGASRLDWLSPLREDDFAEYRDSSFLEKLGLGHLTGALPAFWPPRGPQWDGLARTDRGHVILVEAKAHLAEFCSPSSQASGHSLALIRDSLWNCARSMGVKDSHITSWGQHFYQYTNRLAHLHWLKQNGIDARLVLVGFTGDTEMPGPVTRDAWEAAYMVADHVLGIPKRNILAPFVVHAFPSVHRGEP